MAQKAFFKHYKMSAEGIFNHISCRTLKPSKIQSKHVLSFSVVTFSSGSIEVLKTPNDLLLCFLIIFYFSFLINLSLNCSICLFFQLLDINWTGLTNMLDIPGVK